MKSSVDRRSLLKGALGGLACAALPRFALAARAPAEPIATTALTERVWVVSGVGGNVLVLATPDGQVLVDGGATEHTAALRAQLKTLPGAARVPTLFNTHWHPEQTGSNETFGKAGTEIIAHERTRLWLSTDRYVPEQNRYEKALPKAAWPTKSFYTQGSLAVGPEHIDFGYLLEAHTAGDIYVYLRDSNILAVGGAVSAPSRDPELDWFAGGWLGGRLDALALVLKISNEKTRYVPAWGPVLSRSDVQAEFDQLQGVFTHVAELMRKGYRTEDMVTAGVLEASGRHWNDPAKFLYDTHKGMWAHHNTLSHDIV